MTDSTITAKNPTMQHDQSDPDMIQAIANIAASQELLSQVAPIDSGASDIQAALEIQVETITAAAATQLNQLTPAELEKKRQRRFLVVQEIYETEKGYVNDLNNLVRNFLDPLNSAYLAAVANAAQKTDAATAADIVNNTGFGNESGSWITFDQKQAIVRNAAHLLRVQKLHYKILEDAVKTMWGQNAPITDPNQPVCSDPSVSQISKCFLTMMPKLEAVYIPYCSAHDIAMNTFAQLRRMHPNQMSQILEESKAKMNSKLEIQDFLIKPVQRVCKYPLLLNELLKGTPPGTPEHAELVQALEKIKELVSTINERKKKAENDSKRTTLFSRMASGNIATLKQLAALYGIVVDDDIKSLSVSPAGQEVITKTGSLFRGSGVFLVDHGAHDLPFATTVTMNNPQMISETIYVGAFLFPQVLVILLPRKSTSYTLLHIIEIKSISNIQELSNDIIETNQFGRPAFKNAYRITWETALPSGAVYYRSIDLGGKSDKEKFGWLAEFKKLLDLKVNLLDAQSTEFVSQNADEAKSPSIASSQKPLAGAKKSSATDAQSVVSAGSSDQTEANTAIAQLQTAGDIKFQEVYTTESLVAGRGALHKDTSANRMSTMMQAASNASSSASKSLFRKVSLTSKSDKDNDKAKRTPSLRSKNGSIFGGGDSSATKSTRSLATAADSATDSSPLNGNSAVQGSMGDMSKWFSRRSNSISDDIGAYNGDPADDKSGQNSKWAGNIKAKILTVGKFSASSKKTNLQGSKAAGASNQSLASVMSTDSSADPSKKKSLFSSLTRSFSKRRSDAKNGAMGSQDLKNIEDALRKGSVNDISQTPSTTSSPLVPKEPSLKPTPPPKKIVTTQADNLEGGQISPTPPTSAGTGAVIARRGAVRARVRSSYSSASGEQAPNSPELKNGSKEELSLNKEVASPKLAPQAQVSPDLQNYTHAPRVVDSVMPTPPVQELKQPAAPPATPPRGNRPSLPARARKTTPNSAQGQDDQPQIAEQKAQFL